MTSEITAAGLHELREDLEQRMEEVAEEIRRELSQSDHEHYIDLAGQVGDLEDQALADLLVDENLADIHHHVQEYRAIDAALLRMADGTYGECVDCGNPIAPDRLRVNPTSIRCVACQAQHERTHAHEGYHTL